MRLVGDDDDDEVIRMQLRFGNLANTGHCSGVKPIKMFFFYFINDVLTIK